MNTHMTHLCDFCKPLLAFVYDELWPVDQVSVNLNGNHNISVKCLRFYLNLT